MWLAAACGSRLQAAPPEPSARPAQAQSATGPDLDAQVRTINSLRERGEYAKAIEAAKSLLAATEKSVSPDDPKRLVAKRALATAYLETGDRDKAGPLLRDVLAALERVEPRDNAAIASVIGDLAQTVRDDVEAESLARRALELAEEAFGPEHAETGLALNNLGAYLRGRGRLEEAERLMRKALRVRERTVGTDSPLTAQSLCTLGAIAADRGDLTLGESLVRSSLDRRRAVLPRGHSDVAESCLELAHILLVSRDRADEATQFASEAVGINRSVFGPAHRQTLLALHTKADALAAQGRRAESERLHEELIATLESLPASESDGLADALGEYGRHMVDAGKPERGVELCRRAIAIREKAHGPDDAGSLPVRQVLADALYASVRTEDAVREGRAIVAALERAGDDRAAEADVARYALARYLLAVGETEEARSLLRRSIKAFEKSYGPGGRQTLQAIYYLALTYFLLDDTAEAEQLVNDAIKRFAAAADIRSAEVARDLVALRAKIYRSTGRIREAEADEAALK